MNRAVPTLLAAAALLMMGVAAAVLARIESAYRLGEPGLKLSSETLVAEGGQALGTNSVWLPESVEGYESKAGEISKMELGYLPPDTVYGRRLYRDGDGFSIMVSAVLMGRDRTSIHKPQYCLVGQGWKVERSELREVRLEGGVASGARLPVMTMVAGRSFRGPNGETVPMKAVYVYWFVADGLVTAKHEDRMWWMARELLTRGVMERWAYVSCMAACPPGQEAEAYRRMEELIARTVPRYHGDSALAFLRR